MILQPWTTSKVACWLLGLMGLFNCPVYAENLLANPGFESGNTHGWTTWGCALDAVQSPVYEGDYCVRVSNRSQIWQGPVQSIGGQVEEGQTYQVSAWVRLQNAPSADVKITVRQKDSDGTHYQGLAHGEVTQNEWTHLGGSLTLEVAGVLEGLDIYLEGPPVGVNFYVDDVNISGHLFNWREQSDRNIEAFRKRDALVTVHGDNDEGLPNATVYIRQTRHDFAFGSAINYRVLSNPQYAQFFKDHFEWAVMENESKWYSNEPQQNQESYDNADGILTFCQDNNIKMRGHCIYWAVDRWVQDWIKDLDYAPLWQESELWTAVVNRMHSVVGRYKGKFLHWDVNNEMIAGSFYQDRLGPEVRLWMFQEAHRIDPNALLFLNDYNVISGGSHLNAFKAQAQDLLKQGAPIHALGAQCHMQGNYNRTKVLTRLNSLAELELPILVTEFDCNQKDASKRADDLEDFYRLAFGHPAVDGILMWGFWENSHWRKNCHIVNADWTLNEAGLRYEQLLAEWTTDLEALTDTNGQFTFRGFHGDYELTIERPGYAPMQTTIHLSPGPDMAVFDIVWDEDVPVTR